MTRKFTLDSIYDTSSVAELARAYGETAADYDAHVTDEIGWIGHEVLADTAARHVAPDALILDAGAGTGLSGASLRARGFSRMDAIDISEGMLAVARARGLYREIRVEVLGEPLSAADDAYDATVACGVFLGNHAPPSGFDEIVRVTRPGGHVLLTLRAMADPNESGPYTTDDYRTALLDLDRAGAWRLVELTPPDLLLKSSLDSRHQVWVFEVR